MGSPSAPIGTPPQRRFLYSSQRITGVSSRGSVQRRFTLWIRVRIGELPVFEQIQAENRVARSPLIEVCRTQMKSLLLVVGMRFADNAVLYIPVVFTLSYLKLHGHRSDVGLIGVFLAAAAQVIFIPIFGSLSDRIGRRAVYGGGALAAALLMIPYFWMIDSGNPGQCGLASHSLAAASTPLWQAVNRHSFPNCFQPTCATLAWLARANSGQSRGRHSSDRGRPDRRLCERNTRRILRDLYVRGDHHSRHARPGNAWQGPVDTPDMGGASKPATVPACYRGLQKSAATLFSWNASRFWCMKPLFRRSDLARVHTTPLHYEITEHVALDLAAARHRQFAELLDGLR